MPTPFYHLSLAHELLTSSGLDEGIRAVLTRNKAAFLFGKTAPDAQVVSGQPREATHFFVVPPEDDIHAWERMLAAHPSLGKASALPEEQAVFIAGYLCHLQADETWISDIFLPLFGPDARWGDFPQRLYLHNVLRAYMDREVLADLPEGTGKLLAEAAPKGWLPFIADEHLAGWKDYLAQQLQPGAAVHTLEVFASRQGLSAEDFQQALDSEERMEAEIFAHAPREKLVEFRETLIRENLRLLERYLNHDDAG